MQMVILYLFLLGLCLGSFITAFTWRLRQQDSSPKRRKKTDNSLSIVRGRSMCENCKHTLSAVDLIPVFSWLWLRGRCRYCGHPVSWQNPAIELATAALILLSYLCWPFAWDAEGITIFVFWVVFLVGFVALTVYDLRWMELPDKLTYPLLGLAVLLVLLRVTVFGGGWGLLAGSILGALSTGGLFYLLYQMSAGRWIGGGDVKLAPTLGLLVASPIKGLLVIFLASLLGTLASLPLVVTKKRTIKGYHIPFGPFLLLATVIVFLFGTEIVDWYQSLLRAGGPEL